MEPPLETLVSLAFLAWFLSEVIGAGLVPVLRRGGGSTTRRAGRSSGGAILLGILIAVVGLQVYSRLGWDTFSVGLIELGLLLMLAGIAIRQWAIAVLGRFFSPRVRVLEEHQVVERGPYRYVRHPSYTGAMLTMIGAGIASGSWEGLLTMLGVAAVVFGYRIRVEERFLLEELGPEYAGYRRRTKRLLPFLY
ncbi:MAG TPA: isoprenylcysteine carboxylmethyltransferase family protein [Thermoplasmata archaeon]|nr:isoprenylcysteine carboxylmethyltransferase family protein [Thermoplasmata archaeon]